MSSDFKSVLSDLQVLDMRTRVAEKRILRKASERVVEINKRLDDIRNKTLTDEESAAEYQHLIRLRGRMFLVIARARNNLKKS